MYNWGSTARRIVRKTSDRRWFPLFIDLRGEEEAIPIPEEEVSSIFLVPARVDKGMAIDERGPWLAYARRAHQRLFRQPWKYLIVYDIAWDLRI
ncbi:hypothetical protein ACFX15_010817 [Malus domestica]